MANTTRECGCKGYRTCLICEKKFGIQRQSVAINVENSYVYCLYCNKAYHGWDMNIYKKHPDHGNDGINYPGVFILENFLSEKEEDYLLTNIDMVAWDPSQSGRRKQNYGPKCNFKKRKIKLGDFNGFPSFSKFVQEKFKNVPILQNFHTIEQCSLEYNAETGASIDPHIDDSWIWGERIVTVNLLSDSVLTMTINKKCDRYNLNCVKDYTSVVDQILGSNKTFEIKNYQDDIDYPIIRIPMPRRSLLVMFGSARYEWEHQIFRDDIAGRRVCLAYREFTPTFLDGGKDYHIGKEILEKAQKFF
ncbi:alpha-ketoglutarate-dependent dioxygenase alkB homolog 4 [Coccinella septempunctata]|uniref:alpha-ketoglutarate-dependent dioxygenase alkB homolog 4 n=1 Tax=Coccinella septempunctata TaxID=41139 RepID=UPI001D07D012|nr:alpha-ketoglutarate-dependent dioxygenase alkB homolog 4 [Coccinella septempunctata]